MIALIIISLGAFGMLTLAINELITAKKRSRDFEEKLGKFLP